MASFLIISENNMRKWRVALWKKTYLMIKPDGVQRGLIGRIVARLEDKGFKLVAAKLITVTEEQAKKHYAEHEGKDFLRSW